MDRWFNDLGVFHGENMARIGLPEMWWESTIRVKNTYCIAVFVKIDYARPLVVNAMIGANSYLRHPSYELRELKCLDMRYACNSVVLI